MLGHRNISSAEVSVVPHIRNLFWTEMCSLAQMTAIYMSDEIM
jgi:hypothetical protein